MKMKRKGKVRFKVKVIREKAKKLEMKGRGPEKKKVMKNRGPE